ncbi:hypothetical protein NKH72_12315 [Mesorhizobium sp. M0955]|uniref:hypothetical protein n=1 Tax=Mesorhizobium sp. M0955 TaxID=2957033 RepID=UPI00333AF380
MDLNLESDADRTKFVEPGAVPCEYEDELAIQDEVHRLPNLFQNLRGLIDRRRRRDKKARRFLVLCSASIDLTGRLARRSQAASPILKCIRLGTGDTG